MKYTLLEVSKIFHSWWCSTRYVQDRSNSPVCRVPTDVPKACIAPKTLLTLEECMEYIQQDECIEVTPNFIRMRKVILDEHERNRIAKSMKSEA